MKRLLWFLPILMLLAACTPAPTPAPEPPTVEEEPALPGVEDATDSLVWRVEPTLEYEEIYYCCGNYVVHEAVGDNNTIDPETGLHIDGGFHGGHGGGGDSYFYDEGKNIYGCYMWEEGYSEVVLWSAAEFLNNPYSQNSLRAIEKVNIDSIIIDLDESGFHSLMAEKSGKFAIMYGPIYVTDFIYGFDQWSWMSKLASSTAMVVEQNEKTGIIDIYGNIIVPFVFDDIQFIDDETAFAKFDGKYGILELPQLPEISVPYVTTSNLNLRAGPSTEAAIITTLPKDTTVIVTDFRDNEWYLVEYDGQVGYMKAEFLRHAALADEVTAEIDSSVVFEALLYQLHPAEPQSPEEVFPAEFIQVYEIFTAAVRDKDLAVIDSFLADDIFVSFGEGAGKEDFYEHWNLNDHADQSLLWAELQQIIKLGGTYDWYEKSFTAPYTFTSLPDEFDGFEHCIIIDSGVNVYAEANTSSAVIDYLNYNIMRLNMANADEYRNNDMVKIQMPAGQVGYIEKKYIRSPIDYRFSLVCNSNGQWKLSYMVAGD